MTYEIPSKLEYKEKIIFGLTFKQLIYLIIFFFISILFYKINYYLIVPLIPLAILCMYTKAPNIALSYIIWILKNKKQIKIKSTNKTLKYKGKECAILKINPLNFTIRSQENKDNIMLQFQEFLNSLDFSIQIIIKSNNLLIEKNLLKDWNLTNNHKLLFEQTCNYLLNFIQENSVINRNYYVIIPKESMLDIQCNIISSSLDKLGLNSTRLIGLELKKFEKLYEFNNKPTFLNHKNKLSRTISIVGYPRIVQEGFLDKIISLSCYFDLSIHLHSYSISDSMILLNREMQKQRADLWNLEKRNILNPSLDITHNDTKSVLENIQKGREKLFHISFYITCYGSNEKELELNTKKVSSLLKSLLLLPKTPKFEQYSAFESTLPISTDSLKNKKFLTTKPLSAFFPFTAPFYDYDKQGIMFGINRNNLPIIKDIFKLVNANGIILSSSGGGKSFFTKLMIMRLFLKGTKIFILDPQGEYSNLAKNLGGEVINISKNSDTMLNPLDLFGLPFDEKRLNLIELFPLILGEITESQKAILDKAITDAYLEKGFNEDPLTWDKSPPILADILKHLIKKSKFGTTWEKEVFRSLINRIELYVSGVLSFLNKPTHLKINKNFVCFNIVNMPNAVKPVIMFLLLEYLNYVMQNDISKKIVVIDEAWSLLKRAEEESYVFKMVKTCRKFQMGLLLITQDSADLTETSAGKAILNNAEYTLLFRQKSSIIKDVKDLFQLSRDECNKLLTASPGEGILLIGNEHLEIKVIASNIEKEYIEKLKS